MSPNKSFRFCILAIIAALSATAFAADLPRVRPEVVGLSTQRLERINALMQKYVDQGRLGGAVTLIARNGKVAHLQAFGQLDPTTGA
ncbi:MAG TPA: serine hydrolase, partial [Acidobacteriota bacterium]|nr:serine hydrolase [Acidobacteriota bacterium]